MQARPTVSVVIPVFNAEAVIARTLESVLAQTWTDYEIVVVDDGSTDGSREIVRQFVPRLRLICQENAGVAHARNVGIGQSKGSYIALLDHDDLWHPTKLEKQVAVLQAQPEIGMVVTDVAHLDRDGRPTGEYGPGYNPAEPFARMFVQGYVPTPSAVLIRRSVFQEVGLFDERFRSAGLDDHEMWARIGMRCRIACVHEALTFHRAGHVTPVDIVLEHKKILIESLLQRFGQDPVKRRYVQKEQAAFLSDLGKWQLECGARKQGVVNLAKALMLSLGQAGSPKTALRSLARFRKVVCR